MTDQHRIKYFASLFQDQAFFLVKVCSVGETEETGEAFTLKYDSSFGLKFKQSLSECTYG